MSQLSNCLKMITIIRARGVVNASVLSEALEVKDRMVRKYKRDIEMAGIPIATKPGRYGGYYLEKDKMVPEIDFQSNELEALRAAYEMLNQKASFLPKSDFEMAYYRIQSLTKYKEEIEKTMYYIKRSTPNTSLTKDKEMFLKIHGAILTTKKISISYGASDGTPSERIIRPYVLVHYNDSWYCRGYCELRQEERTFKLLRIQEVTVLDDTFEKTDHAIEEDKLGICDDEHQVELIIAASYAITIPESIWGENQIIKQNEDGTIYFQATMRGRDSIVKWILGMGSCVTVVGSEEMKKRVVKEVQGMMRKYGM